MMEKSMNLLINVINGLLFDYGHSFKISIPS